VNRKNASDMEYIHTALADVMGVKAVDLNVLPCRFVFVVFS